MVFSKDSELWQFFNRNFQAALKTVKPHLVRSVYQVRGGWQAELGIKIARGSRQIYASSFAAAAQLHFLYILNRHDELQDAAWSIALGNPKFLRNQLTLHMLLKSAWIIQDDTLLEMVIDILKDTNMSESNSIYISARKSGHPAMHFAALHLESKAENEIHGSTLRNDAEIRNAVSNVKALDAAQMFDLRQGSIEALESIEDEPAVYRYLARRAVRLENWNTAYELFEKAQVADPTDIKNYLDLGETGLYLPNPLDVCNRVLDLRSEADVKPVEYDRLLGLKHLLEGDYLAFLKLRDVLVSNKAAYQEYGVATKSSMGAFAEAYIETSASCFVIGRDGVSDEIRWSYYYNQITEFYSRVGISCDPRLLSLFARSFPKIKFFPVARNWGKNKVTDGQASRDQVPNMELASRLDNPAFEQSKASDHVMFIEDVASRHWLTRSVNGPPENGEPFGQTLKPKPERAKYWQERLEESAGRQLKVGLIWRSGHIDIDRQRHYMQLDDFQDLIDPSVALFSIQHQVTDVERETGVKMGVNFVDDEIDFYDDFEEIAAFTSQLDLVIGISTLPYEMAGAVGTECYLCAISPLGRWMRLGVSGETADRLTRNGSVFFPRQTEGYLDSREARVSDIIAQIRFAMMKKAI